MKRLVKCSLDILLKNWPTLLLFNLLYKVFCYSGIYGIISDLLSLILKVIRVPYLTSENLYLVLINPAAAVLSTGMILVVTFTVFFETVALYVYCEAGWQRRRLSIVTLLKDTLRQCRKLFYIKNILLFVGFILTTILTALPFTPYILQWLRIPEFVMDFIKQKPILFFAFIIIAAIANIIYFLFLFFLPLTLFQDEPIKKAWQGGMRLLKKRKTATVGRLLAAFAIFGAAVAAILGVAVIGLVIFTKFLKSPAEAVSSFVTYFTRAVPVVVLVISIIGVVWFFSILTTLLHQYREDIRTERNVCKRGGRFHILKRIVTLVAAVVILTMFTETELGGSFIYQTYTRPKIVAHRGGTIFAPENTMAALDKAIDVKADMVEIDVQQLKDGTLILLHDDNFKRITGHNKKVWEVEYSEVQGYDAGSWFGPEFAGEPVAKLEDVLQRAKDRIQVMIELKLTGHEDNLVPEVMKLIQKYDMTDQCNIGSLNLDILKEVKDIQPKMETVYITPLIFSGQYDINFVDAFSVETTSITREMVSIMHLQGKKAYGWTANSEETINKNLQCQVNGIVTDNPELVQYYTMQTWDSLVLNGILEMFFDTGSTIK